MPVKIYDAAFAHEGQSQSRSGSASVSRSYNSPHDDHHDDHLDHEPQVIELPSQKMAVVHTRGDPERMMHFVLPALYSSVYRLKSERRAQDERMDFRVERLRSRWPDVDLLPRNRWHCVWGLPIPPDVDRLPQRFAHIEVEIETWLYGPMAEIVYQGSSAEEEAANWRLCGFIAENGYEVAGPREEEYLSGPMDAVRKVLVRYPVSNQQVSMLPDLPEYPADKDDKDRKGNRNDK